jgi:NAD(P)-dependent dehydrogenase (short-subunit alcohol dehydrogenase family)
MRPDQGSMAGKICIVTGATSGIGEATALALAQQGATLVAVGRNARKCAATLEKLKSETGNPCVEFLQADLSSQREIRELASQFRRRHQRLDVLINNAGARFASREVSADGLEMTLALNHLGYFLLTNLLLDELQRSGQGRVVNVASGSHWGCPGINFDDLQSERGYSGKSAYAQSKLAVVLFTYELARRLKGSGTTANAADPGNVISGFCRNNGLIGWARHLIGSLKAGNLAGPEEGAKTSVYLASSGEVSRSSGRYFVRGKEVPSSKASYDVEAAHRLWEVSAQLVGLKGNGKS